MGWTCSTHRKNETGIHTERQSENLKARDHLVGVGVYGGMILK
jgi:hypothetical protein